MTPTSDVLSVSRCLEAAYARERLEELIRAIVEDALNLNQVDVVQWHDEARFEDNLHKAAHEITVATTVLLTAELSNLIESAPPRIIGRLVATPRFSDRA